jgi:hypothetical protein
MERFSLYDMWSSPKLMRRRWARLVAHGPTRNPYVLNDKGKRSFGSYECRGGGSYIKLIFRK